MYSTQLKKNFTIYEVPRIDPVEKALWLESLESEEYRDKQGKNALKTPDGMFCCLGVYCDVKKMPSQLKPATYTVPDTNSETRVSAYLTFYGEGAFANSSIIPANHLIPWAEPALETCVGWGLGFSGDEDLFICEAQDGTGSTMYGNRWSLPLLNDSGFTFIQIRDIINYFL